MRGTVSAKLTKERNSADAKGRVELYINGGKDPVGVLDMPRFNWGGDDFWETSGTHHAYGNYTP